MYKAFIILVTEVNSIYKNLEFSLTSSTFNETYGRLHKIQIFIRVIKY